jgi:sensor histidine kinase YesM
MNLVENKYFWRITITGVVAVVGWSILTAIAPGPSGYAPIGPIIGLVIQVQIFWMIFSYIHKLLNRWLPFANGVYLRICVQLLTGIIVLSGLRSLSIYIGRDYMPFTLNKVTIIMLMVTNILLAIAINMVFISEYFIRQWKQSIIDLERADKEKVQMQYHHLKNQVNPHFLFNAFTSLDALVKTNTALASEYIGHLSSVFRYVLEQKENTVVPLSAELEFLNHYISLQKIRFGDALQIRIALTEDDKEKGIVVTTLQMLIDNAIKHNEIHRQMPLVINIFSSGDFLIAENNKMKKDLMVPSTKMGLKQLTELYRFLSEYPVSIEDRIDKFSIKLPLL